jgi:hypothetical protein
MEISRQLRRIPAQGIGFERQRHPFGRQTVNYYARPPRHTLGFDFRA